ncbi:hypothetical protein LQ938_13815 [Microbacterium sp. cx-55]|uniref:hypothetical protein n=1 Tax=Microbacterium sp. cx-55 TaxID=2875948 RepID=UPI001CBB7A5B|nr:hypothetical protein [Microbacterium sp. cx-55]MBZ4488267.1 hypothetical protein [Microbacterium sp. cx-55]UGB34928.1 hypothetical protein LQ938_13815 [Microbacterium sp. cx-55]
MTDTAGAPRKRAAFESPARLARPLPFDPGMKRPMSTVAGAALVLLRVATGVLWLLSLGVQWPALVREADADIDGISLTPDQIGTGFIAVAVVMGLVLLADGAFAVLILRGHNIPRVIVMTFSTISIGSAFVTWWAQGQEIRIHTTLVTLSLDILVLLALSSRSAAAYARRFERR